jgi:hypothetical protein
MIHGPVKVCDRGIRGNVAFEAGPEVGKSESPEENTYLGFIEVLRLEYFFYRRGAETQWVVPPRLCVSAVKYF